MNAAKPTTDHVWFQMLWTCLLAGRDFCILGALLAVAGHAHAATVECADDVSPAIERISHVNPGRELGYATLSGPIEDGDGEVLVRKLENLDCAGSGLFLLLDSNGGSFVAATKIASYIRLKGIGTILPESAACLSACSVIFMSGAQPAFDGFVNTERWMHPSAKLGFHAPFIDESKFENLPPEAFKDQLIAAYRTALNASSDLIVLALHSDWKSSLIRVMLQTPPEELYFIDTLDKAGRWAIGVYDLPDPPIASDDDFKRMCLNFYNWSSERDAVLALNTDTKVDPHSGGYAAARDEFESWMKAFEYTVSRQRSGAVEKIDVDYVLEGPECRFTVEKGVILEGDGWANDGKGSRHRVKGQYTMPGYLPLREAKLYVSPPEAPSAVKPGANNSLWNHNGSQVSVLKNEKNKVVIRYLIPKPLLVGLGIKSNSILFEGLLHGMVVEGTARLYSKTCGVVEYKVAGVFKDDSQTFTLNGAAPKRDKACRVTGYDTSSSNASLEFVREQ
jgi:hypothetical protein